MFHVYTGRALFINLTDNTIHEEIVPEAIYKGFIGGNVLGIRFLYERMKPGVDPLLQAPFPPNPFGDYDKKGPIYATGSAYYQLQAYRSISRRKEIRILRRWDGM